LCENKGRLVHLTVTFPAFDDIGWTGLLESTSMHPSLLSLDLKISHIDQRVSVVLPRQLQICCQSTNDDDTFDSDDWDTSISPRLECNDYRKRFPSILKIEVASTLAQTASGLDAPEPKSRRSFKLAIYIFCSCPAFDAVAKAQSSIFPGCNECF
jgi:hypothetical protein